MFPEPVYAAHAGHARRKRSKTGCYTCRQRKVRCDEHHPVCGACLRLGLSCAFPALQVLSDDASTRDSQGSSSTSSTSGSRQTIYAAPPQTALPRRRRLQALAGRAGTSTNVQRPQDETQQQLPQVATSHPRRQPSLGSLASLPMSMSPTLYDVQSAQLARSSNSLDDSLDDSHADEGNENGGSCGNDARSAGYSRALSYVSSSVPNARDVPVAAATVPSTSFSTFSTGYESLSSATWWSSLGEGLLDVNWLEGWGPGLDDHILRDPPAYDYGMDGRLLPSPPPPPSNICGPDGSLYHCGFGGVSSTGNRKSAYNDADNAGATCDSHDRETTNSDANNTHCTTLPRTTHRCRNVTLQPEDRPVLHHFTTTMVRFCILRNCVHDNLYTYILLHMGMFHSTLFDAMMAWSALHLAHEAAQQRGTTAAKATGLRAMATARYNRSYVALLEDLHQYLNEKEQQDLQEHISDDEANGTEIAPSLLLATAWFLLQYQLILAESAADFCRLIDLSAEVARAELQRHSAARAMRRIGPVGSLILVWMSFRDSQAAHLGLGGRLIGCLKSYPHIYDLVDASAVSSEGSGHSSPDIVFSMERPPVVMPVRAQVAGQAVTSTSTSTSIPTPPPPLSQGAKPSEMQTCMKLCFQNVTVAGQIKFLGGRRRQKQKKEQLQKEKGSMDGKNQKTSKSCTSGNSTNEGSDEKDAYAASDTDERSAWDTVRANLGLLRRAIELDATDAARAALGVAKGDLAAIPVVEPIHYNRMLLLAAYYTSVIQYHNWRPPLESAGTSPNPSQDSSPSDSSTLGDQSSLGRSIPRSESDQDNDHGLLPPTACADRMIRLCQRVAGARPNSPQGLWPTHALIAGTTTRDPIYQAWVLHAFAEAERWGAHIVKARALLEAVVRRQNATGMPADLVEVMKETTGIFIF